MNYPHGRLDLNTLKKMMNSIEYDVYYEENSEKPCDWDWKKYGFYRGNITPIKNENELVEYVSKELKGEGTICYDFNEYYFKKHPHCGESVTYVKPTFFWEWQSYDTKKCYSIIESSYFDEEPKYKDLSLCLHDNDFEGTCFVIGTWERNSEGYEFRSVNSRTFNYVDDKDLSEVWKAIKNADKYLNDRFHNEED